MLYFEKQNIEEILIFINDINNFKLIDDTPVEKDKLLKLIDLVSNNNHNNNNNNNEIISNEIKNKCDDINITNDTINK